MSNKSYIILMIAVFNSFISLCQIPEGYYDSAMNLSGESLKTALHYIIKDHVEFPYTSMNTDVWDILKETDRDTVNPDNVILLYSGWTVNAELEYNSGKGWTREHVWAKSHGDFGITSGAGTDIHHLRPADVTINSARNNKDFDIGGDIYTDGDGPTDCLSDEDSWEPRDAVKGDVARMLFYMAIRYEGEGDEPDLELVDVVNSVDLNEFEKGFHGKLSTLLQWHIFDPVDSFEIQRNNIIYCYQQNRNPFIDHPEFVQKIWTITGMEELSHDSVIVYPNPATDHLTIEVQSANIAEGKLYSVEGKVILEFELLGKIKLFVNDLTPGEYFVKVVNQNKVFVQKVIIN